MKIKKILVGVALLGVSVVGNKMILAHEVESNNEVSALLHIYPYDAPIAGERGQLEFTFWDDDQAFALSKCKCAISILDGDKEVFTTPLAQQSTQKYQQKTLVDYTFTRSGEYHVRLVGEDKGEEEEFGEIDLDYTVNVSGVVTLSPTPTPKNSVWGRSLGIGALGLAGIGLPLLLAKENAKKHRKSKTG